MSLIPGLPAEISCRIISFLGAPYSWSDHRQEKVAASGIASYATISRMWQAEVEQQTFGRLYLTPDRVSHALARKGLLSPVRVSYIRSIHLDVLLAGYDDAARRRVESDEEKCRNNETFSITVRRTLRLLGRLYEFPRESLSGERKIGQLTLILTAQSPSDPRPGDDFVYRRQRTRRGLDKGILELRYQSSYLELLPDPDGDGGTAIAHINLPFTTFIVHGMPLRRFFSPAACCQLAARMHRLRQIKWQLWDNEKKDVRLRRRMRDQLARAIPELPSSVEDVELRLHHSVADDYSTPEAGCDESCDNLSAALGRWSRNLRELYVQTSCLGHDFFVAAAEEGGRTPPGPAKLRSLTVELSTALPSGAWLLTADPDEDDDDSGDPIPTTPTFDPSNDPSVPAPEDCKNRKFRQSPAEELIKPLIDDIAGAVGSLPELMRLDVSAGPPRAFSIVYDADDRLLEIRAVPKFVPGDEAVAAWKHAARVQIGRGHVLTARLVRANVEDPLVEDVTEVRCEL